MKDTRIEIVGTMKFTWHVPEAMTLLAGDSVDFTIKLEKPEPCPPVKPWWKRW